MSGEGAPVPPPDDPTAGIDPTLLPASPTVGASFGRYRDLQLLGAGGMATVYKAHDPTLGRPVALKLLRGEDPQLAERLLLEARAQARIEHENVCRIYEAGVVGGRPYIAMQFVDGWTLKRVQGSLSLEEKLNLVKEVCEAVHSAHRVGLVHRDLKPSNVMVERAEDGAWHPYVMDFGLAREVAAPGLTQTGLVLGTPWYMSPEQARGEGRTLDRRSDVYSLGATLYELLGGVPPFHGDSSLDILVRVMQEEPVSLSRRNAAVPADVQTVVMKCLEKDPARRYDSARALAEDLRRYLDGEPIQARPTRLLYRLVKRARKHRAAVVTGGVAGVLVLATALLGVKARADARLQAALAADFARTVQDVEWLMRVAHMAPLHDTRRERARVTERLARIEARMREVGPLARGPGEYALGRGQLVLGSPEKAREHLEAAWEAGYRTPAAAYALGLALGALYRTELTVAAGLGTPELRAERLRKLRAQYRDPAVAYLRQSAGLDVAAPEYVEGLLAFYERRDDEAVSKAAAARERVPWLYEASLLAGDVHAVRSRERHETGDRPGSRRALDEAQAAYRDAAAYGRSDPAALEGFCQVALQRMEWALYERGDLAPAYDASREACGAVLTADPDRAEAHAKLANIHRFWANHLLFEGREPLATLDLAADHARRAIALDPRNRRAHGNLGVVYRLRAQYEEDHGLGGAESLRKALEALERAVELSGGDAGSLNDLGNAYVTRALGDAAAGRDPRADLSRAVAYYDRALGTVADFGYAHANRGLAFTHLARHAIDHGLDPAQSVREAIRSQERAVALLPGLEGTHTRLADAFLHGAEYQVVVGGDPAPDLARARRQLDEALRLNASPGPDVSLLAGRAALVEARHRLDRGHSLEAALGEARARFRSAAAADTRLAEAPRRLGEVEVLEAQWRVAAGGEPGPALGRASRAFEEALHRRPNDARALAALAQRSCIEALWRRQRGRPAAREIADGIARADAALGQADLAEAAAVKAVLQRLRAETVEDPEARRRQARDARATLDRAFERNGHLRRAYREEALRIQALLED